MSDTIQVILVGTGYDASQVKNCLSSLKSRTNTVSFNTTVVVDQGKSAGYEPMRGVELVETTSSYPTCVDEIIERIPATKIAVVDPGAQFINRWLDTLLEVFNLASDIGLVVSSYTGGAHPFGIRNSIQKNASILPIPKWKTFCSLHCFVVEKKAWQAIEGFGGDVFPFGTPKYIVDQNTQCHFWSKGFTSYLHEGVVVSTPTSQVSENPPGEDVFNKKWGEKLNTTKEKETPVAAPPPIPTGPPVDLGSIDPPPLVSIITTLITPEQILSQAASTVVKQEYKHFEWVIVCFSSEAAKWCRLLPGQDSRIRVVESKDLGNRVKNTIFALRQAKGQYICQLDHGDLLTPGAIKKTLATLVASPHLGAVFSARMDIDSNLKHLGVPDICRVAYSPFKLITQFVMTQFRLFRRNVVEQALEGIEHDDPLEHCFDYDLCLRVSELGEVIRIPEVLYHNRKWPHSYRRKWFFEYFAEFRRVAQRAMQRRNMAEAGYSIRYNADNIHVELHKNNPESNADKNKKVPEEKDWDALYAESGVHFSLPRSLTPAFEQIKGLLAGISEPALVDLGCGENTQIFNVFKNHCRSYTGVDVCGKALEKFRKKNAGDKISLIHQDSYEYLQGLPDSSVDGVFLLNSIVWTRYPQLLMFEVYRVLKEGGFVLAYHDYNALQRFPLKNVQFWSINSDFLDWMNTFFVFMDNHLWQKQPEPEHLRDIPVTLFVPTYNRGNMLPECVYLTGMQSHRNFQFQVYDDGSVDNTEEVALSLKKIYPHLGYTRLDHVGIAQIYPIEYGNCQTPFAAQVDSDDYIAPRAVEILLDKLLNPNDPEVRICFSDYMIMDNDHQVSYIGDRSRIPPDRQSITDFFMTFQFRMINMVAWQRMTKADFPLPNAPCGPDYDLSIRLIEESKAQYFRSPLYYYRQHPKTINSTRNKEQVRSSRVILTAAAQRRQQRELAMIPREIKV